MTSKPTIDGECPNCGGTMLADDGCPWCGPDTIPAPPPGDPNPAEMVKVELETLRLERDAALASVDALRNVVMRLRARIAQLGASQ
jgi:hypothetical protein